MAKELTTDVLRTVANFLLLACGKTTTLDVRKNLEVLGYEAKKDEVSQMLDEYYQEGQSDDVRFETGDLSAILKFELTDFGGKKFRMYSFVDYDSYGALEHWCYDCDEPIEWCTCDEEDECDEEDDFELGDDVCDCSCSCSSALPPTFVATKLRKVKVA